MASTAAARPPEPVGSGLSMLTGTTTVPPGKAVKLVGMLSRAVTVTVTVATVLPQKPSLSW